VTTADLVLLSVAFAFMAGGLAYIAVSLKRVIAFFLDQFARDVR
jgi:hypothetical protein